MKFTRLLVSFLFLSVTSAQSAPNNLAPNQKVAEAILVSINDEIVYLSDLQKVIQIASNGQSKLLGSGQITGPLTEKQVGDLLDQLIDQRILSIKVKELTLNVGDDELESEIGSFLKNQGRTIDQAKAEISSQGESWENYREEFRRQLETRRFIQRVIRPLVTVTDEEIRNSYLQEQKDGGKIEKVKLRSLTVNMPANLSGVQKNKKQEILNTVQREVAAGSDFKTLVKLYSDSPDAAKTEGMLPARPMSQLPPQVAEKLKTPTQNQVVGPIQLGSAVFFFQYLGSEFEVVGNDFEKKKPVIENKLLDSKFEQRLKDYIQAEKTKLTPLRRNFVFFK